MAELVSVLAVDANGLPGPLADQAITLTLATLDVTVCQQSLQPCLCEPPDIFLTDENTIQ